MGDAIKFGEYEPEDSPHEEDWVKVDFTFGIFIDGTLNNMKNTEARQAYERANRGGTLSAADQEAASHYSPGGGFGIFGRDAKRQRKEAYDNWLAGRPFDKDLAAEYEGESNSYENDLSNVARLYKNFEENTGERRFSIYTEGIGTEDHGSDDNQGYAFGEGKVPAENEGKADTGIIGKVRKNLEQVFTHLQQAGDVKIGKITIDVFGFSRGAAAVRHLVHDLTMSAYRPRGPKRGETVRRDAQGYPIQESQLTQGLLPAKGYLGLLLKGATIEVDTIDIRFAGLFDTVAHHGVLQMNDVGDLGLDSISRAKTVIHLTAADEHRSNFDLDTIQSVGEGDNSNSPFLSTQIPITRGRERALPGVHSDIGGGYREGSPEFINELFADSERSAVEARKALLISEGWFLPNELFISTQVENFFKLRGFRKQISNQYCLIPLHFMGELAVQLQSVTFKLPQLLRDYRFTANRKPNNIAFLESIKAILKPYVFENGPAFTQSPAPASTDTSAAATAVRNRNAKLKALRNGYLHWSADGGRKAAFVISPHKPNNTERTRTSHSG
jgi:uncharacterized protein (DUF2235 family)